MAQQLVIQTAFPGDLLLSIPLIRQIRFFYPKDEIVLVCRPGLGELFLKEGLVGEIIEVNKKNSASMNAALKNLGSRSWQRVFCPHESYRTALWVRSMRVHEFSVGFKKWWNRWAFSRRVEKSMNLPEALRQLSLLRGVNEKFKEIWDRDIDDSAFRNPATREIFSFTRTAAIPEWASMRLRTHEPQGNTIYIAPGSVWPTKMWTEGGFMELAKSLGVRGLEVIFVGSPAEKELCERLALATSTKSLAGKTSLLGLIELFRFGKALVSNDSGAMHAAAVAGLPSVAIFGPTVLEFGFRPWQNQAVVAQIDLSCRPCAVHGSRRCPLGTHACMRDLPASRIETALNELIDHK